MQPLSSMVVSTITLTPLTTFFQLCVSVFYVVDVKLRFGSVLNVKTKIFLLSAIQQVKRLSELVVRLPASRNLFHRLMLHKHFH
ncbi:hypothetical protein SS1G_09757 [Sclerotinia sclerotiorum 1980 UF-70]|uniref:Uncharacterized protein n=1 Tax=Sclerotinia sclerotiorum (strain ATCC 18683 / 1980 / Ss-1) TaxID=665079 RepID=A7EWP8_SCLS1|nr:hypothetical protein SS1G_09757 [Sclerotinia sclerotiorum 1980 UF-70]EDN93890.1 hypothetical protein SS1G_09757 [Sclerotinia sclerotiorum 1980 UF-70]